jgi:predicted transcriptional regulator
MTHQITVSDHLWGKMQRVSSGMNLPPEDVMAIAIDHYIHHEQAYEAHDYTLVPNAQTQEAMRDGDLRRNLTHHTSLESLFKSWEDL